MEMPICSRNCWQSRRLYWPGTCFAGVPYDLTPEFLDELFTKHRIDYVVHGDDPCYLPDGTDAYAHAKKQGRFRMVSLPLLKKTSLVNPLHPPHLCCLFGQSSYFLGICAFLRTFGSGMQQHRLPCKKLSRNYQTFTEDWLGFQRRISHSLKCVILLLLTGGLK